MFQESLIYQTGQLWKLHVLLAALVVSFIVLSAGFYLWSHSSPQLYFVTSALSVSAGLGSFVFACRSVKCDKCGSKWFWDAVRTKPHRTWALWLAKLTQCPQCGFSVENTND